MRKLIFSVLLASAAATPAVAQEMAQEVDGGRRERSAQSSDGDRAARRAARAERMEARRAERPDRVERVSVQRDDVVQQSEPRGARVDRSNDGDGLAREARRERRENSLARQLIDLRNQRREGTIEDRRDRDGSGDGGVIVRRDRDGRRDGGFDGRRDRDGSRDGGWSRDGSRDQTGSYRDGSRRWSGSWRSDSRYDWRRHRDRNRSIFRFGSYYDPYRYGYRRFSIGFNLWPSYYSSRYWLNDPWQYRLPPTYGPYRWVRYYDDALLVNIYTGQVVDVIHSFFW